MSNDKSLSLWDEIRQMRDELEVKVHLGGMDARDRWQALKVRVTNLEGKIKTTAGRVDDKMSEELHSVGGEMRKLRDDLTKK